MSDIIKQREYFIQAEQRILNSNDLTVYSALFKLLEERKRFMIELSKIHSTEDTLKQKEQTLDYYNRQIGMLLSVPVKNIDEI